MWECKIFKVSVTLSQFRSAELASLDCHFSVSFLFLHFTAPSSHFPSPLGHKGENFA